MMKTLGLVLVAVFCAGYAYAPRTVFPAAFGPPAYDLAANRLTTQGIELGRQLFYDPILSRDSTVSCGTCHQQFAAFAHIDHALSHGINGRIGTRNVPSIQNLAWSTRFMWDGGITHMDLQPLAPITQEAEMDNDLATVLARLEHHPTYRKQFAAVFGSGTVTTDRMCKALSQFIITLISASSRFDSVQQHRASFTEQERLGYSAFQRRCASCHKEPLFTDHSFRSNGLPLDTALRDLGRYRITHDNADSATFKVPTLRNVELTHPYMHDGRFRTLRAVLDHYGSTLFPDMTSSEKKDIIAFLLTLTDRTFISDPRFSEPRPDRAPHSFR